jgi:hypothetical protein
MSGGGSANSAPQNQTVKLPEWVDEASQDAYLRMKAAVDRGYIPYQGQTVAGLNADQTAAFQQLRDIQGQADPSYGTALGIAGNLAGGAGPTSAADIEALRSQFMNPYTSQVTDAGVRTLQNTADRSANVRAGQAGNVGAFGGTRYAVENAVADSETARQAGDLSGQLNLQGYNTSLQSALGLNQQNKQMAMTGLQMLPQLATARSGQAATEAGWLQGIGGAQQAQQQQENNDQYRRWLEAQNYPIEAAQMLGQTVSSLPFGSETTSQTTGLKKNKLAGAAAGAAAGASLGSVVPGYGTAVGAAAGGLLGYFA